MTFTGNALTSSYRDDVLESVPVGAPDDPASGNHDPETSIVAPGVIRLGISGKCSAVTNGETRLCAVRNELRELQDERAAFRHPAFFAVKMRLAGAVPGARNHPGRRDGSERLMVAQIKFGQNASTAAGGDFSPLLALRYEDDLLYVTTELMGEVIPRLQAGNRCLGGVLARRHRDHDPAKPYRVLLASEDGRIPYEFDPAYQGNLICLKASTSEGEAISVWGASSFPRQRRDRFVQLVMQIDGERRDTAYVRLFLDGAQITAAKGRIALGVDAQFSYFKFGPYGTLPRGRRLHIDYADFRRAPGCAELGLAGWKGQVKGDCAPQGQ